MLASKWFCQAGLMSQNAVQRQQIEDKGIGFLTILVQPLCGLNCDCHFPQENTESHLLKDFVCALVLWFPVQYHHISQCGSWQRWSCCSSSFQCLFSAPTFCWHVLGENLNTVVFGFVVFSWLICFVLCLMPPTPPRSLTELAVQECLCQMCLNGYVSVKWFSASQMMSS